MELDYLAALDDARRLNWTEAISRAQRAPTKGPSLLNQRLGTIHGGAGEARGAGGWVPDPPGHAKPGYALENESPAGRSAGGCQVVGAGPRPPGWVAIGPKPKPRGAGGAPGPLRGEGRRPAQGYFLSLIISRVRELQQAFAASIEPVYRGVPIGWVRGTPARVLVRVAKPAAKRCRSGTGLRNGRIVRDPALHKGEGLGEYESTYVPMHHIHPRCLDRTAPHLMLPCDLQMSGTGRQICGR